MNNKEFIQFKMNQKKFIEYIFVIGFLQSNFHNLISMIKFPHLDFCDVIFFMLKFVCREKTFI